MAQVFPLLIVRKEKTPEFTKMGEIHELFVLALSFGLPGRLLKSHSIPEFALRVSWGISADCHPGIPSRTRLAPTLMETIHLQKGKEAIRHFEWHLSLQFERWVQIWLSNLADIDNACEPANSLIAG